MFRGCLKGAKNFGGRRVCVWGLNPFLHHGEAL